MGMNPTKVGVQSKMTLFILDPRFRGDDDPKSDDDSKSEDDPKWGEDLNIRVLVP